MKGGELGKTNIGGKEFRWGKRTYIMGVLNITPDSFSGDGLVDNLDAALASARAMEQAGADIIDIGGESTRPPGAVYGAGAEPVPAAEELRRIVPVLEGLRSAVSVPVSIDSYKAEVAEQAVKRGAALINDVWGLKKDPAVARVAAEHNVPIVLMHNQEGYEYADLVGEIAESLQNSRRQAQEAGVSAERIILDPGIGFGKTAEQSLEVMRRLGEIRKRLNRPILVGSSRKSFIGSVLGGLPPEERLEGTAATVALAVAQGADMVRVHDVREMARVARMSDAIVRGYRER